MTLTAEQVGALVASLHPTYIAVEDDLPRAAHRLADALAAFGIEVTP